jgi:hypothetical protein
MAAKTARAKGPTRDGPLCFSRSCSTIFFQEKKILNSQCPSTFTIHSAVGVLVHLLHRKLYLGCPFCKLYLGCPFSKSTLYTVNITVSLVHLLHPVTQCPSTFTTPSLLHPVTLESAFYKGQPRSRLLERCLHSHTCYTEPVLSRTHSIYFHSS